MSIDGRHRVIRALENSFMGAHGLRPHLLTGYGNRQFRGFVEMPNKEEADKAIAALNGKDLKGRTMTVNEARPRTGGGEAPRTGNIHAALTPTLMRLTAFRDREYHQQ